MAGRIAIIDGHPDSGEVRLCHALAETYAEGAEAAGRAVKRIDVAALDFPLLRSQAKFEKGAPVADIAAAQEAITWADHIVIVYPLWLGTMPALLKGFLEQVLRPGFAFDDRKGMMPAKRLRGRSARIVVTMGMPAFAYRWFFGAHSLKSLERNILKLVGIGPIQESLFGMVEAADAAKRAGWLDTMRDLGRRGV
jgi:putative NADPH-quinone reductase